MQPSPIRTHSGCDPEKKVQRLKRRFGRITTRFERARKRRKFVRDWSKFLIASVIAVLVAFAATTIGLKLSPWPPSETIRHLASFPNCDAARTFGLAPAPRGEPGYYVRHDRDEDGIACEPWPHHRRSRPGRSIVPYR